MIDRDSMGMPGWRGSDGNAAYLDKTLLHDGMEVSLDDRVSLRVIALLAGYSLAASVLAFLPFLMLGLLFLLGGSAATFGVMYVIGWLASIVVFWAVLLGSKLPEPISEWRVLLDDRVEQGESVYSKIAGTLKRRAIPLVIEQRRIRTGSGPSQVNHRLVLREGSYVAYVSVFNYGSSLYLGWMMWRSRRGAALIKQFLSDLVNGILGRNDPERVMLRTERPRAMREAVHAACREGLVTAIDRTPVPLSFGFPGGLAPIEGGYLPSQDPSDLPPMPDPAPPLPPQSSPQPPQQPSPEPPQQPSPEPPSNA
jgi:hypothetical protein